MKCKWFLLFFFSGTATTMAQLPVASVMDSNAVKSLYFAALKDKLNENYPKAIESFNKVLAADPKSATAHYEIAALYYRQNKLKEAELSIKQATALDGNNSWYWKLQAELYKRKGDMQGLVKIFDHLIRLSPDVESYYFDRSNALLLAGKTEEAVKGYEELESKFGPSEELTEAKQRIGIDKNSGLSKQDLNKALSEPQDVKSLLHLGNLLLKKGELNDALAVVKKAKQQDDQYFDVDLTLADIYKAQKNNAEAHNALKRAFASAEMPVEQKAKVIMMVLSSAKSKELMVQAAELAQIAVATNPNDARLGAMYADVLYRQGDLNSALGQYLLILKADDQIYKVWEQVLNIQTLLGLNKEAIKTADEALSIYPNQAILYYFMAQALLNDNQNEQALTNINIALQMDAENAVYMELYGDLLFLKGDKALGLAQWKKAKAAGRDTDLLNKKINEKTFFK